MGSAHFDAPCHRFLVWVYASLQSHRSAALHESSIQAAACVSSAHSLLSAIAETLECRGFTSCSAGDLKDFLWGFCSSLLSSTEFQEEFKSQSGRNRFIIDPFLSIGLKHSIKADSSLSVVDFVLYTPCPSASLYCLLYIMCGLLRTKCFSCILSSFFPLLLHHAMSNLIGKCTFGEL